MTCFARLTLFVVGTFALAPAAGFDPGTTGSHLVTTGKDCAASGATPLTEEECKNVPSYKSTFAVRVGSVAYKRIPSGCVDTGPGRRGGIFYNPNNGPADCGSRIHPKRATTKSACICKETATTDAPTTTTTTTAAPEDDDPASEHEEKQNEYNAQDSKNIAGLKSDQESAFKRLSRTKKECGECQTAEDALIKAYGVAMKAHTVYEKVEGFVLDINAKNAAMLAIKLDKKPLEDALAGISSQVDGFGCDNLEGDDFSVPEAVATEAAKVDNALKEYKRAEQAWNEAKEASAKDEVCGGSACDDTTLETAKKAALASDGKVKANEGGVATACKNIDLDDDDDDDDGNAEEKAKKTVKAQSLPLPTHIARAAKLKTMMADIDAKLAALN